MKIVKFIPSILLVLIGFQFVIFEPNTYVFSNSYDGIKNYFTFYGPLATDQGSVLWFELMNYPFGDLVFFSDQTPLIAMPLKLLDQLGLQMQNIAFPLFHLILILSHLLSSYFIYLILKRYIKTHWLLWAAAVIIPWFCPQLFRLTVGNMNLSMSWLILAMFELNLRMLAASQNANKKKIRGLISLQFVLVLIAAMVHIYFVPMLVMLAFPFGVYVVYRSFKQKANRAVTTLSLFAPALGGLIFYLGLKALDPFQELRREVPDGYNWDPYNFQWDGLFAPAFDPLLPSFFESGNALHFESLGYLGGAAIYGSVILIIIWVLSKYIKKISWPETTVKEKVEVRLILIAGLFCLFTATGEQMEIFYDKVKFDNILSPIFWLGKIDESSKQFRMLARLEMPFFWVANMIVLILADRLYQRNIRAIRWLPPLIVILMIIDGLSGMRFLRSHQVENPLTHENVARLSTEIGDAIDLTAYQAILPIPFYHVGSEDKMYIMDPEDRWCTMTYQLCLATKLPLMSSKMSRSAVEQNVRLLDLFQEIEMPKELRQELNPDKDILVVQSRREESFVLYEGEIVQSVNDNSRTFAKDRGLEQIWENDDLLIYRLPL